MDTESKQLAALQQERANLIREGAALFAAAEKEERALSADAKLRDDRWLNISCPEMAERLNHQA